MEYTEQYIAHIREIRQLQKALRNIQDQMSQAKIRNDVKFHKYLGQSLELSNYINILVRKKIRREI